MRYTKTTLKKIENLMKELGYSIRYERGNFLAGYAIVEEKKIAVINRFYDTEARINALAEIITTIEVDDAHLSEEGKDIFYLLKVAQKSADET